MRMLRCGRLGVLGILIGAVALLSAGSAGAEWYVAGYGGVSLNGRISDGDMPLLGQRLAQALFPNPTPAPNNKDYLFQTFRLNEDIKLKNSPMFGARVGYYFTNFNFPWAGVEIEAFTTQPNIKQQTLPYSQNIVSNRSVIILPQQPETTQVYSTVSFGEARLRVTTLAANAVIRYPGKLLQPYAGVGVGVFYFQGSTPFHGTDLQPGLNTFGGLKFFITEKISLFGEYKYNRATISRLDDVYGLKGNYSISHIAGGVAYHF